MKLEKISIANVITSIILIIVGVLLLNAGCKYTNHILNELDKNCKTCSIFDKDCPYTDEELLEQEYGDNPYCRDMGVYEMRFKVFGGGMLGVGMMFMIMGMIMFYKEFNKPTKRGPAV